MIANALLAMAGGDFDSEVGSASEESPEHLRNGLWAAHQLLSAGASKAYKRVLIFTTDPTPQGKGPKANTFKCAPAPHSVMSCV